MKMIHSCGADIGDIKFTCPECGEETDSNNVEVMLWTIVQLKTRVAVLENEVLNGGLRKANTTDTKLAHLGEAIDMLRAELDTLKKVVYEE